MLCKATEGLCLSTDAPAAKFGGQAVVRLLEGIQANSGSFHQLPIGPVGAQLALNDDNWAYAVEAAIGKRIFNSFIVHDFHDMNVLKVNLLDPADLTPFVRLLFSH